MAISIEEMAIFCKKKGFVYPNSEIYGGLSGFYDYGPLGVELKNNIKQHWWRCFVQSRDDIVGIDGTIITHPKVWEASGHAGCFSDIMLECCKCHERIRADQLVEEKLNISPEGLNKDDINRLIKENGIKCSICRSDFSNAENFNLMFTTHTGPVANKESLTYLRPETAQQMFTNFKLVLDTSRVELPFGIAQTGRAFRNEISPRDFLFRTREFEQMEIEYFIHPEEEKCPFLDNLNYEFQILTAEEQEKKEKDKKTMPKHKTMKIKDMLERKLLGEWHVYWLKEMHQWFIDLGISRENLRLREHRKDELAHYSSACFDIEYKFPFGWKEVHGMANRGSFDLKQHSDFSKKSFEVFDIKSKKKIMPIIIEPSQGVDRALLAFIFESYKDDKERGNIVLKLHPILAPYKFGVFPLVNKLHGKAMEVHNMLKNTFTCFYDKSGSIGRRYARADEIGIPYCITIDFDTLKDHAVTIRDINTTKQKRIKIDELETYCCKLLSGKVEF